MPQFVRMPTSLTEQLPSYLMAMLPGNVIDDSFADFQSRYFFIYCDSGRDFAVAYQEQNALAHWGVAIPCKFAIAWEPNKYLLWHESLHLMNAKDCYNKFGINKCPNHRCIMRRAPSLANCGDRLTLCSKNIKRISRFSADVAASAETNGAPSLLYGQSELK